MRGVRPVVLCLAVVVAAFEVRAESAGAASGDDGISDYESHYLSAVESYLSGHWAQCVSRLKAALAAYRMHVSVVVGCRTKCRAGGKTGDECARSRSAFYIAQAAEAHCLRNCVGPWHRISIREETVRDFRERLPYNYLQRCYFELGDTKAAATAAYTFLESNPGHSLIVFHLSQYLEESGLSNKDVASLENNEYQNLFRDATKWYAEKKYAESSTMMEQVISSYLKAEEECRILCEDFLSTSFVTREFSEVAAGHHLATLKCREQCPGQVSYLNGRRRPNFFAGFYHYLQFSYYQLGELQKACEATQSYLLLVPDDADMWYNQAFYARLPSTRDSWFKARSEVEEYVRRQESERETIAALEVQLNMTAPSPKAKESGKEGSSFNMSTIRIVQDEAALNGTRFVAEGFLTEDECSSLLSLIKVAALTGDGYDGKQSPHSKFETFEGITAGRIALLTRNGTLDRRLAQLFYEASDRVRSYVESRFNLASHLYFSYTHLVCRAAVADFSSRPSSDMSHSVHADNCILQKTGECLKQLPAYIWRDFSAVLYLNDDFVGGDFVFARHKTSIQASVKPKCGRAVAFSAGVENLHGVLPIEKGRRCALAMWYTLDPKYREREREIAYNIINRHHSSPSTGPDLSKQQSHEVLTPPQSRSGQQQDVKSRYFNEL